MDLHKMALAGNPNCGKTTLFNVLTGSNQYVGNWAGVTVEKKTGISKIGHSMIVDLPGIYSLSPYSMEEVITRDYIIDEKPEVIINIIDGTNIERNLYLTIQLLELGRPMVIAINMMDEVRSKGDKIDCDKLSYLLGATVIPISAKKGENIEKIIRVAEQSAHKKMPPNKIQYDTYTQNAINDIIVLLSEKNLGDIPYSFYAPKLLEGDSELVEKLGLTDAEKAKLDEIVQKYEAHSELGDRETMLADARYKFIEKIVNQCVVKNSKAGSLSVSDKIDLVVTNRILAIPIFLLVMFVMFSLTFGPIGTFFSDLVDKLFSGVLAPAVSSFLLSANAPEWTHSLLVDAVIGGIGGILVFLPQIAILFLFLSILEDSGYMARAAFIMDRFLRKLGLSGKSFIPMLMGFGCTTPAVMATRTLENEKDRRLTIILTPFMSCGARLPIYALFAGAFFPQNQGLVVFSMYILGIIVAILAGIILKKTLFKGNQAPFVMELPAYRLPSITTILLHVWEKTKGFLVKAGTIIFAMSVVIWFLQNFSFNLSFISDSESSILASLGKLLAPLFAPLGFGNWQSAVALITGLIAKESVVSTLTVLYSGLGLPIGEALKTVFTPACAYGFMVFTLLYTPCISAFATIKREMNSAKWTTFTLIFQIAVAYLFAFVAYRIGLLF